MSFSGTPLGQGRRLDHSTFLNKPPSNGTSYSFGAPIIQPRSPQKPPSTSRDTTTNVDEDDETALIAFARQKQREASSASRLPGAPKIISSPPKPDSWSVKDTSVIIASAFNQAASASDMNTPNNAWASGSTRPNPPRSTSVEYESQVLATNNKRLAPPPSKLTQRTAVQRKPLSKVPSIRHVPDSEGEEDRDRTVPTRGKSPFDAVLDSAKRLGVTASFYLQQKTTAVTTAEPGEPSKENESSYGYEAEEREFQNSQSVSRRSNTTAHRRNRMSVDNKAYKPSVSEEEDSDDDFEEDGKTRKGSSKKLAGLSLPVMPATKRKKRKSKGGKGNAGDPDDSGRAASDEDASEQVPEQRLESAQRASITRNTDPPIRHTSVPRGSVPRDLSTHDDPDTSVDVEQGLSSIPEVNEDELPPSFVTQSQRRSTSRPPSSQSRIGGPLGHAVNFLLRQLYRVAMLAITILTGILYFLGQFLGTIFHLTIRRPYYWASKANVGSLLRYAVLGLILMGCFMLRGPLLSHIPTPSFPSMSRGGPVYTAPNAPAGDIAELAARLQRFENALSMLSKDAEIARLRAENEAKAHMDYVGRLGSLESKVVVESRRAVETEQKAREASKERLDMIRQEMELLKEQWQAASHQRSKSDEVVASDEEARLRVKSLEQRVESVEGGMKEALELGKKAITSGGPSTAWWNKLTSGNSKLTIKSSDGQDVTSLIERIVDSAVTTHGHDILARPDYALHSGGARVIPSLTSPTFEIRPSNLFGQLLGSITGNGYAIGHPPVMALHPEIYNGRCWPFAGTNGQLGVVLASPTLIEDVTIDHVAKEVAYDMRTAPRQMELWGMVEGQDNTDKVQEWIADRNRRREEARERGEVVEEETEYPSTLPQAPQYIRIANFSYDIHGDKNVQTFPVNQEVKDLGVDFGIVVLMVKNNWGRDEYTCLYRLRVHGQRLGETPSPQLEEEV